MKKELWLTLTPYTKMNQKCNIDPTIQPKTIKLLQENRGENFWDLGLSKDVLDLTSKAWSITNW